MTKPVTSRGRVAMVAATVVAAGWLVRTEIVDLVAVTSDSMAPTVCAGDRLLVLRVGAAGAASPGDQVTFTDPVEGAPTLKRVVAVGGEKVEIRDAVLHVDGRPVREPYVDAETVDGTFFGPVTVPAGAVFLLGDSREFSIDSRDYGAVPRSRIDGVVLAEITPGTCGTSATSGRSG